MEAVRLAQSGEASAAQVARELGVNANTLYNWVEKYGSKPDGADSSECQWRCENVPPAALRMVYLPDITSSCLGSSAGLSISV